MHSTISLHISFVHSFTHLFISSFVLSTFFFSPKLCMLHDVRVFLRLSMGDEASEKVSFLSVRTNNDILLLVSQWFM